MENTSKNMERGQKKQLRLSGKGIFLAGVLAVVILLAVLVAIRGILAPEPTQEVITVSTLQEIMKVSRLSTFTAVYNGVAKVTDEEDEIKYYVSYDAKVNAGIDFDAIEVELMEDEKVISITLPEISIPKVNVDISSMDYIFVDKKANASTVSAEAYKACEADALEESTQEEAIYELAKQNAENIVKALVDPFVNQVDSGYEIKIGWEEE